MKIIDGIKSFFTKAQDDIRDYEDVVNALIGLSSGAPNYVHPRDAYFLAERNNNLGTAVTWISDDISSMRKGVKDSDGGDIKYDDPLIQLLNDPNDGMSGDQFMNELSEAYLLTQECWILARGRVGSVPLALNTIRPYDIEVFISQTDGLPYKINTNCAKDRRAYFREIIDGQMRFISLDGLNELCPIIGDISLLDGWRGRSRLVKLFYDLNMGTDGKRHNLSLLKNGMRTTGILSPKPGSGGENTEWGPEAVKGIVDYIRTFNQGSGNAGNVLVLGRPVQLDGLSQNNRDMDFISLLGISKEAIYSLLKIPLPLVMPDQMTYNNYTTANRTYFYRAVFPVFDDIASGIMNTVGRRFGKDPSTEILTFSEVNIRDLRGVLVEDMKEIKDTNSVSVNEVRSIGGFESIPAGDDVLVPANLIPLGSTMVPEIPEEEDDEETADNEDE